MNQPPEVRIPHALWLSPKCENLPQFKSEIEWADQFAKQDVPDEIVDAVADYALDRYERLETMGSALDTKAWWTFTLATALTSATFAGITAQRLDLLTSAVSIVPFITAVILAIGVIRPAEKRLPRKVRFLLESKTPKKDMAISLHVAAVGLTIVQDWKARRLTVALRCIVIGLCLLAIPMIVAAQRSNPAANHQQEAPPSRVECSPHP